MSSRTGRRLSANGGAGSAKRALSVTPVSIVTVPPVTVPVPVTPVAGPAGIDLSPRRRTFDGAKLNRELPPALIVRAVLTEAASCRADTPSKLPTGLGRRSLGTALPLLEKLFPGRVDPHRGAPNQDRGRSAVVGRQGALRLCSGRVVVRSGCR